MEIDLAVEKHEVVYRAHNISAHFGRESFNSWHKKDFDRHIVQTGTKRDARLPNTPTIYKSFAPGAELEDLIKKVMDQPKEVLERVRKLLGN